ncbi:MAG: histidine phosphatase family protein [Spirochaetales bacterium]|jgi:broad specificity phosphatase PhoE|nr:histidine phosphatase family protein [Spirochaetales bacterium]
MTIDFSTLAGCGRTVDFFLLRHGKSEGNKKDIVQGRIDYPLSDEGREQAQKTGAWLAGRGIISACCSPLARASETAAIAAAEAGLPPPLPLAELRELDTGVYTGLTLEDAREKYPDMWPRFQALSWEGVEKAESVAALRERAAAAWNALIHEAEEAARLPETPKRFGILAVSHAGFLQWLIKIVSGGERWFPLFPMGHCGVYHLSVTGTVLRWEAINFQAEGVTGKR